MIKTISVIGLGRIGLPTAVLFASHGYEVFGCEKDTARRELLLDGRAPFHEPGLEPLVTSCIERGDLTIHEAPQPADATVICIGTTNADALFDASRSVTPRS